MPARKSIRRQLRLLPVVPSVLLILLFLAAPVLWSFHASFTNAALTGRNARNPAWTGLENYTRLLSDAAFPASVVLTMVFVVASRLWARTCWDSSLPG